MSSENTSPAPRAPRRGMRLAGVIALVAAAVVVGVGITSRASDDHQIATWTNTQAVPTVTVALPQANAGGSTLDLPGRLEAYSRAPIFARVSGYLKSWKVDIGAQVKEGQLLAEIESPDIDQQLLQAQADLAKAQADAALAGTSAKRWQAMLDSDSVSKQEVDERTGSYTSHLALVQASQANVRRIQAMKDFTRIVAPFAGVVTARETDVGALINGNGGGQELFVVSDVRKLRAYIQVPQNYVPLIQQNTPVTISVPEYPGEQFSAKLEASSRSVSASSGTTLIQLSVDNAAGKLMPGSFANVSFSLPVNTTALRIASSSLVFNSLGMRVATVGHDNKVVFKQVVIAHDLGSTVEIGSGLNPDDRVIDTPPDGLVDGDLVKVAVPVAVAAPHA